MYSSRRYNKYPRKYRKRGYNIKDIYSPSLYKANRPNYYQQKGRVLQQSPRMMFNSPNVMISKTVLDNYYQTLLNYKYPIPEPDPELKVLSHTYTYPNIDLGPLEYTLNSNYSYSFSDIWPNVMVDFEDILAIENLRIQNLYFYVSLVGFSFGGQVTYDNYKSSTSYSQTFDINTTDNSNPPDFQCTFDVKKKNGLDAIVGFGALSFNNSYALQLSQNEMTKVNKESMTDQPFLNMYVRQQPAMLTVLREENYDIFNPILLNWIHTDMHGVDGITLDIHQHHAYLYVSNLIELD